MVKGLDLGMRISYAEYMTSDQQPYVEFYFAVDGNTLAVEKKDAQTYNGGVEVVMKFYQDSTFIKADKFRILSPDFTDTLLFTGIYLHQERYLLPRGTYTVYLELFDIHKTEKIIKLDQKVEVHLGGNEASISSILLLDRYEKAKEESRFAKSGYDLYPIVDAGFYYFTENMNKISFYSEVYNLNNVLGQDSAYALKQYIENSDNQKESFKHSSIKKKNAKGVQPILSSFDIKDLASGKYNLVIEVLNNKLETVVSKKVAFYRSNPSLKILAEDIMLADITQTFVFGINDFDTLNKFINYLFPISDERAQMFQRNLIKERDLNKMQSYFFAFWSAINPDNPEEQWRKYHKNVRIANKLYHTRLYKGYRSQRGRIFLLYGEPSLVEKSPYETGAVPWQAWQYNTLTSPYNDVVQTNKVFVFAEFDLSTNDYELIHSDAYGELSNRRWQFAVTKGKFGPGSNVDQNNPSIGDGFGSKLNNNIIMQGRSNR